MIVFDLRCGESHVFEAWFGSTAAYEDQRQRGLVACPLCGDTAIDKAVMAPNIGAKGNQRAAPSTPAVSPSPPSPEAIKAALGALAEMQGKLLEQSQWVGRSFATRARAMHMGDEPHAAIHGQATREEAQSLAEEGVPLAPLPLPVIPPDACN